MLRATLFRICVLLAVFLLLPGCRTATPAQTLALPITTAPQSTPKTSADVLGFAEIQAVPVANAFEVVMRLRPEFLKRRVDRPAGEGIDGAPIVYLDGVKQGGTEMLRSIPIAPIYEIRYLSATAASAQFGPFYPGGVIAVRTRPGTQ